MTVKEAQLAYLKAVHAELIRRASSHNLSRGQIVLDPKALRITIHHNMPADHPLLRDPPRTDALDVFPSIFSHGGGKGRTPNKTAIELTVIPRPRE